jgi:DnaJ-domain-containing protein 1
MLSMETIDPTIKASMKEQRLKNLQAQWFEFMMNKVAFEANGLTRYMEEADRKLTEIQTAYDAILAIDVSEVTP